MSKNVLTPFYYIFNDIKYKNFNEFIKSSPKNLELDYASIYSIISKGYIVGSNTIIANLHHNEWSTNVEINLKNYNSIKKKNEEIARDLIKLLSNEILNKVKNKKELYILLSGGMDSRILAVILKKLENDGELKNKVITGLTWGVWNSRDVQYAKKICEMYGWKWEYLKLSEKDLSINISYSIDLLGAEVSPIHLHKFYEAGLIGGSDESLILAASYGDSLGRGEYSGVRVKELSPLKIKDNFQFFKRDVEGNLINENIKRLEEFRSSDKVNGNIELEYQYHYLYKMLHNASTLINYNSEIFQIFSTKAVIEYILSLKFECRNDEIYLQILKILDPKMLDYSWARTGKKYLSVNDEEDNFKKNHHSYSTWIKENYSNEIFETINSKTIARLGIFDIKHLNRLFRLWKYEKNENLSSLTDRFLYLYSLKLFIEKNRIYTSSVNIEQYSKLSFPKIKSLLREIYIISRGYLK